MAGFSIVTNVSSLVAQENLIKTNNLQQRTITRLTSGLRINSSADDAAGLAIANRFRSDIAVLRQGVRNAADGLSTLQTIDGGLNNISLLIDRARTLATQSGSGTFTGDRSTLNAEFQSVITEIDRQAQAVGLDPGGAFNAALSVFIGGGRTNNGVSETTNGSVQVDLSNSAVSANILGLSGVQVLGSGNQAAPIAVDLGDASATSVQAIATDATNLASLRTAGFTEFIFSGSGFSDSTSVRVAVNLSGVMDTSTLSTAINDAINGFTATSQAGQAFKNAGITAGINTDAEGEKQLTFSSSDTAFQAAAGDRVSNALLGNVTSVSNPTGTILEIDVDGAAASASAATTFTNGANILIRLEGGGLADAITLTLTVSAAETVGSIISELNTEFSANTTLTTAGFSLDATAGSALQFTNSLGQEFKVFVSGDEENHLGLGTFLTGDNTAPIDTQYTGAATGGAITEASTFSVLIGGSVESISVAADASGTRATRVDVLNAAIAANATLASAGLVASESGTSIRLSSTNGSLFQLNVDDTNGGFGFSTFTVANGTNSLTAGAGFLETTFNSGGADASTIGNVTSYADIVFGGDDQTITFTANDATGAQQSINITLANDGSTGTITSLDEAVQYINSQLQQSNNPTLQSIVAVKERNDANSGEGIRFLSTLQEFRLSIGATENGGGLNAGTAQLLTSDELTGGSIADISTKDNAEGAVTLLSTAVAILARIQADVGKGQNNLTFAIGLASTQITNLSAAESRIRDADLAAEAANLTRASIAQQAGIAALAQANSAPQAVLALLRG